MIAFPNCKINLGLHILQKRTDGFHDLETVFYPVVLKDGLEIIQHPSAIQETKLTTSGLVIDAPADQNICFKAYQILKKDFPQLPSVQMHLHKVIPSGAGLGGGSSDGAFTLLLLNQRFNLGLCESQLIDYALQLGSDCPFFIKNKACYATGRGEKLKEVELNLAGYTMVLVNPDIHVNTGQAFGRIVPNNDRISILETIKLPVEEWKDHLKNDFEEVIFSQHPEIKSIKEKLYKRGAVYASMSGSGSTVYGLFKKDISLRFDFPGHYFLKLL